MNAVKAEPSMLTDKPYFTLRIETKNTYYLAKVNGVVIFDDNSNGHMLVAEKPVNYYMQTGKNTISLELFPSTDTGFGSESVTLSLYVNEDEAPESEKKLVSSITFNGRGHANGNGIELSMPEMRLDSKNNFKKSDEGDVVIQQASIKLSVIMPNTLTVLQSVSLQTPFPKWGFLNGDKIDFTLSFQDYMDKMDYWDDKIVNPFYKEYQKIYDLLAANKLDEILALYKERNREYDIAMYYPEGTYDKKIRRSFEKDLSKYNLKIRSPENGAPYISDDQKLLKLGNVGLIYFVNDEETSFINYEILFYKKNGKWIISR